MNKYLLVINAGSSSIKFAVYRKDHSLMQIGATAAGQIEGIGSQPSFTVKTSDGLVLLERKLPVNEAHNHTDAINIIRSWLWEYCEDGALLAVGHRVVHGGQHYSAPVLVNATVLAELETLVPLAPLHQPHNLATIRAILETMPSLPQVVCFDTAFHRTQPNVAQTFAIPRRFVDEGIRHYGFHGLSYEYIASVLPELEPALANARIIVAHLGSGASLCAIQYGRSIATTMGFSPLDGLVMGTRCGNIDPGVLLYLMDHHNMDARALEQLLYHQSGLLGVSGISSDMRTLLASDDPRAHQAIELFVYRAGREIGSLAAALGGLDALVFTGGIGEHSAEIRAKICHQAAWLGLELDDSANEATATCVSTQNSKLSVWIVPTDENLMIARHTLRQITFPINYNIKNTGFMNNQELWQRYQNWLYFNENLGLYLDVSRMRFDDSLVAALELKFAQAFKDMAALEQGIIANPDENRMVGHYWLRNPELAPPDLKNEIVDNLDHIEDFVQKVHNGTIHPPLAPKFTDVLSIGIGGSALGPQFVDDALAADFPPLAIHFIDNTDPAGIDHILNRLKDRLSSTLVIVTSKSGGTPETRNGMLEVKHAYERQGLHFPAHAVAVTMLGSKMDELERIEGWLDEFPMFDWVGGRTSEMSSVGLLSASLMGIDIRALLEGAKEMDVATRVPEIRRNPAALLALCWYYAGNGKGEKDMVVLPYKDSLLLFSRYLQQLVMESLGKEKDLDGKTVNQGLAVYGNKGSTDQHAFVQQLREGVANFFTVFIEVLQDRNGASIEVEPDVTSGDFLFGFLQGTRQALYDNHRDSITVTISQVNPRTIGALIALFERAVGFYASLVNINAYNQPGVEAGKKAAETLLELQRKILAVLKGADHPLGLAALAEKAEATDQIEHVYKIVRHLAANQRGVDLHGDQAKLDRLTVSYNL